MNKKQKSLTNKGFSLVELIIVIAIMAVLIGVLAPQYLKYVENSRVQKDVSAADEFQHAVEIAVADETIYNSLGLSSTTTSVTVTAPDNAAYTGGSAALLAELNSVVPGPIDFTSSSHNSQSYVVTISYTAATGAVTVSGAFN